MLYLKPIHFVQFLPTEFYAKNKIKNIFNEMTHLTSIKNSITLNELPIVLINILMSISQPESKFICKNLTDISKDEWNYFLLVAKKATQ
jgi:hypothetical protein